MGWTSYRAQYYNKNGKVDRKKELESGFSDRCEVVASSMVGSTYYGAIKDKETGIVSGHVILTSTDWKDGWSNFGYKIMSEDCGPFSYQCPVKVLDALSPTTNKTALEWRQACRKWHEEQKEKTKTGIGGLPVGTVIEVVCPMDTSRFNKGDSVILTKCRIASKKRPVWAGDGFYWTRNVVSKIKEYKILKA